MSYKQARRGAALAGSALFAMPVLEVVLGFGTPGPLHVIVAAFGVTLVALSARLH